MTFANNLAQVKEQLGVGIRGSRFLVPTMFDVGTHRNQSGESLGTLAVLAYAREAGWTVAQALAQFEEFLDNPQGHPNILALLDCDRNALVSTVFQPNGNPFVDRQVITDMWEDRANVTPDSDGSAVLRLIDGLDCGGLRIASKVGNDWVTDQTLKQAVLLSFRLRDNEIIDGNGYETMLEQCFYDKVPLKFAGWTAADFKKAGIRVVPGAVARYGSFMDKGVILMPSFVNIGARVGEDTMVDAWATVGSCAQIGKNCHLSGGVGIGGVLEPLQANPTIIGDDCFIGARSEVVEGVVVENNCAFGMGVYLGQSTPVYDRPNRKWLNCEEGKLVIPSGSVVIAGSKPSQDDSMAPGTYCAVIVKKVDAGTKAKTALNEILR